jgi:hypothetical protein
MKLMLFMLYGSNDVILIFSQSRILFKGDSKLRGLNFPNLLHVLLVKVSRGSALDFYL